jgi:hypothetical protein
VFEDMIKVPESFEKALQEMAQNEDNIRAAAPDLLEACRAALDAIMKHCAQTGDVIWIDPPHQLGFVHESVCERLRNVIAQAEGRAVEDIDG